LGQPLGAESVLETVATPIAPVPAELPDRDAFGAAVAPGKPHHSQIKKLFAALAALDPGASQDVRVAALEELFRWLRSSRSIPTPPGAVPGESVYVTRVRLLTHAAKTLPRVSSRLSGSLASTLEQAQVAGLFASLGLPSERGLWNETVDRLSRRTLT
jgi:site-specific recombinase